MSTVSPLYPGRDEVQDALEKIRAGAVILEGPYSDAEKAEARTMISKHMAILTKHFGNLGGRRRKTRGRKGRRGTRR